MAMQHDITMVRGDTLEFDISVDGEIGTVVGITMTARRVRPVDNANLFSVSLGNGITSTEDGWHVRVPPSATQGAAIVPYKYDVEFSVDADVYTPIYGKLVLIEDVTTRG